MAGCSRTGNIEHYYLFVWVTLNCSYNINKALPDEGMICVHQFG